MRRWALVGGLDRTEIPSRRKTMPVMAQEVDHSFVVVVAAQSGDLYRPTRTLDQQQSLPNPFIRLGRRPR